MIAALLALRPAARAVAALACAACLSGGASPLKSHDLVIAGARVIDPASGFDGIRNIAIDGDRIVAISQQRLAGRTSIDARGLVLGPGLIDLHSHGMNVPSNWLQAFDGVTTALELEGGAWPVADAYRATATEGRPLNYGYASGWEFARRQLFGARGAALLSTKESQRVVAAVAQGLDQGGLGIALTPGYIPLSNRREYLALAELAAQRKVPSFTHIRFKNLSDPGTAIEGIEEVIAAAAMTRAHMHICHINSSATRELPHLLALIANARRAGIPVSIEAYPWGAGSTGIGAPFLAPENLPLLKLTPGSIEYLPTGERIADNARLAQLRAQDPEGRALIHYLDEQVPADNALIDAAILATDTIIASDTVPYGVGNDSFTTASWPLPANLAGHPRSAATFIRVLKQMVIDSHRMSLIDFFRRASLLPARLLERTAPEMRGRGRIAIGSVADLVLIDLATASDQASYARPAAPSKGVRALIVSGRFVIRDGRLIAQARPGRPIRGAVR